MTIAADSIETKLIDAVETAKKALREAEDRLRAFRLISDVLVESGLVAEGTTPKDSAVAEGKRYLTEDEVGTILGKLPKRDKFTHKVLHEIAEREFGEPIDPTSVRVGLNRIVSRPGVPIQIVEKGKGQRPTVFQMENMDGDIFD